MKRRLGVSCVRGWSAHVALELGFVAVASVSCVSGTREYSASGALPGEAGVDGQRSNPVAEEVGDATGGVRSGTIAVTTASRDVPEDSPSSQSTFDSKESTATSLAPGVNQSGALTNDYSDASVGVGETNGEAPPSRDVTSLVVPVGDAGANSAAAEAGTSASSASLTNEVGSSVGTSSSSSVYDTGSGTDVSSESTPPPGCSSECTYGCRPSSNDCFECSPNLKVCRAEQSETCDANGFLSIEACEKGCDEESGKCRICVEDERTCDQAGNVVGCSADGQAWTHQQTCEPALGCVGAHCAECVPGSALVCSSDGRSVLSCGDDHRYTIASACSDDQECLNAECVCKEGTTLPCGSCTIQPGQQVCRGGVWDECSCVGDEMVISNDYFDYQNWSSFLFAATAFACSSGFHPVSCTGVLAWATATNPQGYVYTVNTEPYGCVAGTDGFCTYQADYFSGDPVTSLSHCEVYCQL